VIAFWVILGFALFGFQPKRPGAERSGRVSSGAGLSRRESLAPLIRMEET